MRIIRLVILRILECKLIALNVALIESHTIYMYMTHFQKVKILVALLLLFVAGFGFANGEPMYVVNLDTSANRVIVGREKDLYMKKLLAENLSWKQHVSIILQRSLKSWHS